MELDKWPLVSDLRVGDLRVSDLWVSDLRLESGSKDQKMSDQIDIGPIMN